MKDSDPSPVIGNQTAAEFAHRVVELPPEPPRTNLIANRYLRALLFVMDLRTMLHCLVACAFVFICDYYHIRFSLNFEIVSMGSVFPMVFGISQAYARRDRALITIASLKGIMLQYYMCHRDWDVRDGMDKRSTLGDNTTCAPAAEYLGYRSRFQCLNELRMLEAEQGRWELYVAQQQQEQAEAGAGGYSAEDHVKLSSMTRIDKLDTHGTLLLRIYQQLNVLSILNERLTPWANYPKAGEGGMSRLAQYIRQAADMVENLRVLKEYRTPIHMRYSAITMVNVCTVLLAPYFANLGSDVMSGWSRSDRPNQMCPAGYIAACLFLIVTLTLYRVMVDLEQPFDGKGMDDVYFELDNEFLELVAYFEEQRRVALDMGYKDPWESGPSHLDPLYDVEVYQHYTAPASTTPVLSRCGTTAHSSAGGSSPAPAEGALHAPSPQRPPAPVNPRKELPVMLRLRKPITKREVGWAKSGAGVPLAAVFDTVPTTPGPWDDSAATVAAPDSPPAGLLGSSPAGEAGLDGRLSAQPLPSPSGTPTLHGPAGTLISSRLLSKLKGAEVILAEPTKRSRHVLRMDLASTFMGSSGRNERDQESFLEPATRGLSHITTADDNLFMRPSARTTSVHSNFTRHSTQPQTGRIAGIRASLENMGSPFARVSDKTALNGSSAGQVLLGASHALGRPSTGVLSAAGLSGHAHTSAGSGPTRNFVHLSLGGGGLQRSTKSTHASFSGRDRSVVFTKSQALELLDTKHSEGAIKAGIIDFSSSSPQVVVVDKSSASATVMGTQGPRILSRFATGGASRHKRGSADGCSIRGNSIDEEHDLEAPPEQQQQQPQQGAEAATSEFPPAAATAQVSFLIRQGSQEAGRSQGGGAGGRGSGVRGTSPPGRGRWGGVPQLAPIYDDPSLSFGRGLRREGSQVPPTPSTPQLRVRLDI